MSPSAKDYKQLYGVLSQKWSEAFVEYYNHDVNPEVTSSAGRWILEPLGVYNGYSGVTTNQSEGFNTLIKHLTERKESSIDGLVLALYFLQCYFSNEIQRGLAGLGQYRLLDTLKSLEIPVEEMDLQSCYAPHEIVERMMEERNHKSLTETALKHEESGEDAEDTEDITAEYGTSDDRETQPIHASQTTTQGEKSTPGSQMARAQLVLKNKTCIYQDDLKTFVVQGTSGITHAVKLFPKASCTCPAKTECYHILAAKLYMGMEVTTKSKRITMTQLRRNVRPKSSRRKGRKGPLEADEIEPAPDATVKSQQALDKTTPVQDKTTPVLDKTTPVQDKTTPVQDKITPVQDKTTPVLDKTTPALDKTTPALDKTTPVQDKTVTTPAQDQQEPDVILLGPSPIAEDGEL